MDIFEDQWILFMDVHCDFRINMIFGYVMFENWIHPRARVSHFMEKMMITHGVWDALFPHNPMLAIDKAE